jgi:hypothetical protein
MSIIAAGWLISLLLLAAACFCVQTTMAERLLRNGRQGWPLDDSPPHHQQPAASGAEAAPTDETGKLNL